MPYPIQDKLVVAIASSALFDLTESDAVFRSSDLETYRRYQQEHEDEPLRQGPAFPFIRRLLSLNGSLAGTPIEVILLSRNDPDTGLRVMNSIAYHGLPISRAAFLNGEDPWRYMEPFNALLFLSANAQDVRGALAQNLAAGQVFAAMYIDDPTDSELRIAFDFDGIVADDSAEAVYQERGLDLFLEHEVEKADVPLPPGPLQPFLARIAELQDLELKQREEDSGYLPKIVTALVTSRNAPAHERVVNTLRNWGIRVDKAFFLGGMEKARVLATFKPHIFFDDQEVHVQNAAGVVPSVLVPYGELNKKPEGALEQRRPPDTGTSG